MDIHEYQAKELLKQFGISVPLGGIAYSPEQAVYRSKEIGGDKWVVKAQIHSGARGKAGGIKVCTNENEVWAAADGLLGKRLVTHQTSPRGQVVQRLYIEVATDIAREIYIGLVLDRQTERVLVVKGGMEIEEIAVKKPESILREAVEPAVGMLDFQARKIAFGLGLPASLTSQAVTTIMGAYRAFRDLDATTVEIDPLVVTKDGRLLALDAKMGFNDNALFRHPNISELRDKSQEDTREMAAADRGLSTPFRNYTNVLWLIEFGHVWHFGCEPPRGFAYAEKQPICHPSVGRGGARADASGGEIYVAVFRSTAGQDDSHGLPGDEQR